MTPMNKVLFLSFVCAMTLFSSCEREQCLCKENRQVENKGHESERVTPDAPQKPGASELKVDEFGEYITDGKYPTPRIDLTDHGNGFTYGLFGKMSEISRERLDSLFCQVLWECKDLRVVESDRTLAKKQFHVLGVNEYGKQFICRDGKVYVQYKDPARERIVYSYYYDEKSNRLSFIGTDISWEIIRLTPYAVELLQHGQTLWSEFNWYYFRRSTK